jgi:hypothetical protein
MCCWTYMPAPCYRILVSGEPVTDLLAEQLVGLLLDGKTPVRPHLDDPENRTA